MSHPKGLPQVVGNGLFNCEGLGDDKGQNLEKSVRNYLHIGALTCQCTLWALARCRSDEPGQGDLIRST
jgi:hypothetical protein